MKEHGEAKATTSKDCENRQKRKVIINNDSKKQTNKQTNKHKTNNNETRVGGEEGEKENGDVQ